MKRVIVFMVAGMSSRFGGTIPKQFAKVGPNDETLIEISVNDALTQSFEEIVFITNPKTEHLFVNLFGSSYQNIPVFYIQQKMEEFRTRPWGTTDAVCSILEYDNFFMDSIFTIINGDDLYGKKAFQKMTELLNEKNTNYIGGIPILDTIIGDEKVNRGVITLDENQVDVIEIEEKLEISRSDETIQNCLANMNFLILKSQTLCLLKTILNQFKHEHPEDPKIECFLTDSLNQLIKAKEIEISFLPLPEKVIGVTRQDDIPIVQKILKQRL